MTDRPASGGARHEVLVLGAGPAGTAAAVRLARLGFDVGVIEPAAFPRRHVGICIADQTVALLAFLGLGDPAGAAGFWKRALTAVSWGEAGPRFVEQGGYHVDRGWLDRRLLEQAVEEGVTLYQPARLRDPPAEGEGGWFCDVTVEGATRRIGCDFLVDAAGRRSALPGARTKDGPPLIALHADWRLRSAAPFDGLIEAGTDAWAWYAQTGPDRAVVSVFLDPRGAHAGRRDALQARYRDLLRQFPVLRDGVDGTPCAPPQACDAASSHSADAIGARHIRVGDACMSVDPLSSQGVHLALQSGIQAAVIVNTVLRRPRDADLAREFYGHRVRERVGLFRGRMRAEYARAASTHPFWRDRGRDAPAEAPGGMASAALPSDPDLALAITRDAVIRSGAAIMGDFVERRAMLEHPGVDRPVAFLAGADLPALLQALPGRFAQRDLPHLWREHLRAPEAQRVAGWLWERRILVPA